MLKISLWCSIVVIMQGLILIFTVLILLLVTSSNKGFEMRERLEVVIFDLESLDCPWMAW